MITEIESGYGVQALACPVGAPPPLAASALEPVGQPLALFPKIADLPAYLASRKPVMFWEHEEPLRAALPGELRREVAALQSACDLVLKLVKARASVQAACKAVLAGFRDRHWNPKTFRALYDKWVSEKDWTVFVNRAKASADWKKSKLGLSEEFLKFCAARIGQYKRSDARKEALRSIHRQWHTGRTFEGRAEPIPGYGWKKDWGAHAPSRVVSCAPATDLPPGWSYSNIMRQIKSRGVLSPAARALLLQGTHAAKEILPDVIATTADLRFLEEVQFDDVKTDWRIFDPATGQSMDLWLLIARDRATRILLGFGVRPARAREDGTQEHLKLRDMKQLCGWLLERYGLPPYQMKWKIERGTATLSEGSAAALQELLPNRRIKISYSSMIGGTSPNGYFEKRIGNSKGKASLESHNRGMHLIGAGLPGQTGPAYGVRPTDLAAREKECLEICQLSEFLPEQLRGQLGYSLLNKSQAREALFKIFHLQNSRDDHSMEDFQDRVEWWDGTAWRPQSEYGVHASACPVRNRKESPIEKAVRLVAGHEFSRVSPDVITAFYEHTQRPVKINPAGEIEFSHESRKLIFANPSGHGVQPSGCPRLLAYFNPDDPCYLHLTDGRGAILGTWLQRSRFKANDQEALAQAIRYQASALKAARETANDLATPDRAALDAMRAHNARLHADTGFVDVAEVGTRSTASPIQSPIASALRSVRQQKSAVKQETQDLADLAALASEALRDRRS